MQPDDLYPNDGEFLGGVPVEPLEQQLARKQERAKTLEALPELKKMIKRLEERIAFYEKTTSIDDDVRLDPEQFLILHNTYTLVAKTLINEKEHLKGLISANAKNVV